MTKKYQWNYNTKMTAEEAIKELVTFLPHLETMEELNGDMYVSDFQQLIKLSYHLQRLKEGPVK